MKRHLIALVLPLTLGLAACGKEPVAPEALTAADGGALHQKRPVDGTGLALESVTGVTVPLLGVELGDVVIDQAVIKEFGIVEDIAGNIIGLKAIGVLEITGGVLGTDVVTENFETEVSVISKGRGGCDIVTIDLAPIEVDVLGEVAEVNVPAAPVTARGSGALGSLLCNLGSLLQPAVDGVARGVRGLVNAINNLLI